MKTIRTVLCAVDLSASAKDVAKEALRFAEQLGGIPVVLLYAFEPRAQPTSDGPIGESSELAEANARVRLDAFVSQLKPSGVSMRSIVREGPPIETVIEVAQAVGADLIVIGTSGRTGLRRAIMGSVAEGVIRRSSISVLVARPLETGP